MSRSWLEMSVVGALCVIAAPAWANPVRIESGAIEGSAENGVVVYKGVPFAAPPLGDLRWREPQAPGGAHSGYDTATGFRVARAFALEEQLEYLVIVGVETARRLPTKVTIEPVRPDLRVGRAAQKQSPKAEVREVGHDHREKLLADTPALPSRQQGEHDDLARVPVGKAIADDSILLDADITRQVAVGDVTAPRLLGDAELSEPLHRYRVLASLAAQVDASGDVGRYCLSVCHYDFTMFITCVTSSDCAFCWI